MDGAGTPEDLCLGSARCRAWHGDPHHGEWDSQSKTGRVGREVVHTLKSWKRPSLPTLAWNVIRALECHSLAAFVDPTKQARPELRLTTIYLGGPHTDPN